MLSPRSLAAVQVQLPDATWHDADLLVNWCRLVKSADKVAIMKKAARLAELAAETAHPSWDDSLFEDGQTVAFELGGCHRRYNVGLARTGHIGTLPDDRKHVSAAVQEGMNAVMEAARPGAM